MTSFVYLSSALDAALFTSVRDQGCSWAVVELSLVAPVRVHLGASRGQLLLCPPGHHIDRLYPEGRRTLQETVEAVPDIGARTAATEFVAMQYNDEVGARLNDAITGVTAALVWEIWLLMGAAVVPVLQF